MGLYVADHGSSIDSSRESCYRKNNGNDNEKKKEKKKSNRSHVTGEAWEMWYFPIFMRALHGGWWIFGVPFTS